MLGLQRTYRENSYLSTKEMKNLSTLVVVILLVLFPEYLFLLPSLEDQLDPLLELSLEPYDMFQSGQNHHMTFT